MNKFLNKNKKNLAIGAIILSLIIAIIFIKLIDNNKKSDSIINTNTLIKDTQEKKEDEKNIIIHITGEILNQGILKIPEGSRIADAIDKAGGLTENANLKNVNLAYELEDGQKLYIPSINDEQENYIIERNNTRNSYRFTE